MEESPEPLNATTSGGEAGYVLATTALLLIPLMIFAALAVDVGGWYSKATQTQRAADAAALAAVVHMPNETNAAVAALEVAASNGFVDQPGCDDLPCNPASFPQVVVSKVGNEQVRVDIFTLGEVYFGGVVIDENELAIQRFATAQYVLPVPMGNPTSALGVGTDFTNGAPANYWLRAMTECEGRATGDFVGAGGGCSGGVAQNSNPNHRDEGHTFIVDVPADGNYTLQARTTCFDRASRDQANAGMRFRFFDADDTAIDDNDNVLQPPLVDVQINRPGTGTCAANGSDWSIGFEPAPWVDIAPIFAKGRYVLQAKNTDFAAARRSLYSLRIVPSGTTTNWVCTRLGPTASATCPNIFAKKYLTAYTDAAMFPAGEIGLTRLYLAEIDEIHEGKTMHIELFDPADGIESVRIVDPHGDYVDFDWHSIDCSSYGYRCGTHADYGSPAAPISQTCDQGGVLVSCLKQDLPTINFQDRTLLIVLDLDGYECQEVAGEPENCWWQVEYEDNNASSSETTTWGVSIIGDPIRLTE